MYCHSQILKWSTQGDVQNRGKNSNMSSRGIKYKVHINNHKDCITPKDCIIQQERQARQKRKIFHPCQKASREGAVLDLEGYSITKDAIKELVLFLNAVKLASARGSIFPFVNSWQWFLRYSCPKPYVALKPYPIFQNQYFKTSTLNLSQKINYLTNWTG